MATLSRGHTAVARHEYDAWVAYYRRRWPGFVRAATGMLRQGFGLPWLRTLQGAVLVALANRAWAPVPDNDPEAARTYMRRFYTVVRDHAGLPLDPAEAARLEVAWWHVHRVHQRDHQLTESDLTEALLALYCSVYAAEPAQVRPAAHHRMIAMRHSDAWVAAGCPETSKHLDDILVELSASYAALAAVTQPSVAQRRRRSACSGDRRPLQAAASQDPGSAARRLPAGGRHRDRRRSTPSRGASR